MLDFTGERFMTTIDSPEIAYEHWHRYIWLQQFVAGKRVLDIACGEGYGSRLMADVAESVVGIDISEETITYAASKYIRSNLAFYSGSAAAIPLEGHALFDVVVSFETIEHLDQDSQHKFMQEVKRLLRPDGVFFVSTPNKLLYSDIPNYRNEFHIKEFYPQEFVTFLKPAFDHVHVVGQKVYPISYIWPFDENGTSVDEYQIEFADSTFQPTHSDKKQALFLVAICSDRQLAELPLLQHRSTLIDISDQAIGGRKKLVEDQDLAIKRLRQWLDERDKRIVKLDDDIVTLNNWLNESSQRIAKLDQDIALFTGWIAERDAHITQLEVQYTAQISVVREQEQRINQLEQRLAERDTQLALAEHTTSQAVQQLQNLQAHVQQIESSVGWKVLSRMWRVRERVLPRNSLRSRVLRTAWRSAQVTRTSGLKGLVRHGVMSIQRRGRLRTSVTTTIQPENADDYAGWIAENEPSTSELHQQFETARAMVDAPVISVLAPVYNTDPPVLAAMIESVLEQTYPFWELWLVDGSPENQVLSELIRSYAERDPRIAYLPLEANQGIVGNTNAGIGKVTGDYTAFVDHDDLLAPFALFEVAQLLMREPATDLIYSDSDLVEPRGNRRFQPLFKPDWSPAIMLSANYATHLCVIRTTLLRDLGGLTPGSDGAQDWDLILRVSEQTTAIAHIPKILYHWRESPVSTATDIKRKPYVMSAQLTAITNHLRRQGITARAYFDTTGYIRVTWPLAERPSVSIIIPSRNSSLLNRCISSILTRTAYHEFEIIVVDTTDDGELARRYAQTTEQIRVLTYTQPFNYSTVNNLAAHEATSDLLLFLNDDTEIIDSEWLTEMVRWASLPQIGVVGAKLLTNQHRIQHAGVVVGMDGFAGHPFSGIGEGAQTIYGSVEWYRNFSAVTGACLMVRRALFEQIGGFDEQLALCGNDVELCLRIRAQGFQVFYTPFARLLHLENATRGKDIARIPKLDFLYSYQHYRPLLAHGDPFFNPNLSLWSPVPNLRRRGDQTPLIFVQTFLAELGFNADALEDKATATQALE